MITLVNLNKIYRTKEIETQALENINLNIEEKEFVSIMGPSGCGKSTLLNIIGLLDSPTSGELFLDGVEVSSLSDKVMAKLRNRKLGFVFQNFHLIPALNVLDNVELPLLYRSGVSASERRKKALAVLEKVGLSHRTKHFPTQLSGGQCQRVAIARALIGEPAILLADEPTTALDVTIQAQVLDTIQALRKKLDMSMILITHDLGIVAQTCEQVAIIYGGEVVEYADVFTIFENRMHPYTQGLFNSIPKLNEDVNRLVPIEGLMPDPTNLPTGCKFCTRCQYATDRCREEHPEMIDVGNGHLVRCFRAENTNAGGEQK